MIFRKPKSLYSEGELVIRNKTGNFGDENDKLFHIYFRKYLQCTEESEKSWHYNGEFLRLEKSISKGVPLIPSAHNVIWNVPEKDLKKLEDMLR